MTKEEAIFCVKNKIPVKRVRGGESGGIKIGGIFIPQDYEDGKFGHIIHQDGKYHNIDNLEIADPETISLIKDLERAVKAELIIDNYLIY